MRYLKPLSLFQDLLESNAKKRGRLLGLDVGERYVGLAVSDRQNRIASPLSVILRKKTNIPIIADDFQTLISEQSLAGFVFGCPFDRQWSASSALQIKIFIDELCKTNKLEGLKYTFWDERFTSKNVELLLKPITLHPIETKAVIDKLSAVSILQGYLDYVNRKLN
ncbi:uncharacterized protein LOC107429885 [Ziziphus jujuba]|uniref:Uncharacterized protein LOC107429885 n=2 Tax=Ziziphus jujuba TaxID=326968 RepID=A0A6P4BAX5_ZIZJJ|nr:uncharacterized protein LOC107429885 [Ziziphus jujuba]XP_015896129.2 uncharacterized protein LOC107429885 [Ziziphus jujuba]XP_015896132.2 uncharacterized protein LOC107429885 [Ziziphus jujuba]XP_048320504.1 uncharacterized protein LOC107429885 [Ziziphus jujuba]XP_048320505.1 uncharacterized protein LOC107429885 [Ziziphus jujuba]KAH7513939.1 hypothetical protein FEM48_Zijuj11G0036000 [Ziziphus jujuba var. spinosa]